jgi:meso-butanediol dehydrogenase / (S,S)-butanediol dehydrogenase / diacetyl reductase
MLKGDSMFELHNKVAVVSGASGGLGEAMAHALVKQGAFVAILDVKDEGHQVEQALNGRGKYYRCDMLDEQQIKDCINHIGQTHGKIDILINNAGVYFPTPIDSTTKETFEKMMGINVTGYFLVTKYAIPFMKEGGRIVNVASVAGHHAFGSSTAYNASKGAVIQLTRSMALEYASKGINANCICPGSFITPMTNGMQQNNAFQEMLKNSVPLQRTGQPSEIGPLAVYLSSDECSYMTGSIINIDGGWTCHL